MILHSPTIINVDELIRLDPILFGISQIQITMINELIANL